MIRFVRPERRNPLTIEVLEELILIIASLSQLGAEQRIIFTGTGEVFASGADLREIASVGPDSAREFALRGQRLMMMISALDALTIAAVNGFCFGGAMDLTLSCDRRVASSAAVLSHPGANLGIMTGWGGTQRLPRLIGEANALEMFFTAKRIDAREALAIGLIDQIAADPVTTAMRL